MEIQYGRKVNNPYITPIANGQIINIDVPLFSVIHQRGRNITPALQPPRQSDWVKLSNGKITRLIRFHLPTRLQTASTDPSLCDFNFRMQHQDFSIILHARNISKVAMRTMISGQIQNDDIILLYKSLSKEDQEKFIKFNEMGFKELREFINSSKVNLEEFPNLEQRIDSASSNSFAGGSANQAPDMFDELVSIDADVAREISVVLENSPSEQPEVPAPKRKRDEVFPDLFAERSTNSFKTEFRKHSVKKNRQDAKMFALAAIDQGKKVDVKQYWKSKKHVIAKNYAEAIYQNQNSIYTYPVRVVSGPLPSLLDEKTPSKSESPFKKSLMKKVKEAIYKEFKRLKVDVASTTDERSSRKRKTRGELGGKTVRLQNVTGIKRPRLNNNEQEKNIGRNSLQPAVGSAPNLRNRMAAPFRFDQGQVENLVDKFSKDLQKKKYPVEKLRGILIQLQIEQMDCSQMPESDRKKFTKMLLEGKIDILEKKILAKNILEARLAKKK